MLSALGGWGCVSESGLPVWHLPPQPAVSSPVCFSSNPNHHTGHPQAESGSWQAHSNFPGMAEAVLVLRPSHVTNSASLVPLPLHPNLLSKKHGHSLHPTLSSLHLTVWLLHGWMGRKSIVQWPTQPYKAFYQNGLVSEMDVFFGAVVDPRNPTDAGFYPGHLGAFVAPLVIQPCA